MNSPEPPRITADTGVEAPFVSMSFDKIKTSYFRIVLENSPNTGAYATILDLDSNDRLDDV